jgi:pilus assembly protein Flp/PilA
MGKLMPKLFRRLCDDQRGATAIEYGLILALVVVAIMAALVQFAGSSITMWNNVSSRVSQVQQAS